MSSSREVKAISYQFPDYSDRKFVFVEAPGFDDTQMMDQDALMAIADWLTAT
jgi:hypothetical protein